MRNTILRIRAYNTVKADFIEAPEIKYDSPNIVYAFDYSRATIITHYSGVNATNGDLIYEGDILKLSGKENTEPYIGVVCMEIPDRNKNDKLFVLKPAWKTIKTDNPKTHSDTEYFIDIDTPTRGEKRIRGLLINNNYPINEKNGTGFSDGTISEVIGNVFKNADIILPYIVQFEFNSFRIVDKNKFFLLS